MAPLVLYMRQACDILTRRFSVVPYSVVLFHHGEHLMDTGITLREPVLTGAKFRLYMYVHVLHVHVQIVQMAAL